jgi:hypothetical protein
VVALFAGIALALDGPLSAPVAILGLFASAAASAFALWLSLSPYREKYADDPEGKRTPTLRRDAELVNMLWWDIVFSFVVWVVLGFGAAYLLTQGMNLLTEYQGTMLQIFVLLMIPLIALSGSGGTAQRHLKADWVEPLTKVTRTVRLYGFGFFGLLVVYGTLNWFKGTFVELLRTKGGLFFEIGYVTAIAAAIWFSFSALWRVVKEASAAQDERQEAAREARRKAKAKKAKAKEAKAKSRPAAPARSTPAPSQSPTPQSDEFDYAQPLVHTSESELPSPSERTQAQRAQDAAEAANELLERAVGFDWEKLKKARAKWLEDVEYTPQPETREFAKLVFEDPGDKKCIELIKAGANPNVKTRYDVTALILASENGLSDLVRAMLENGAFPDQRGSYQHTALSNALSENHSGIAIMLIEAGANVNTTGNCGFTPLMSAASTGNDVMVSLLMKRGADPEYRVPAQYGGLNAQEIADRRGHNATAKLIEELKSRYKPKVTMPHGMTYPGRDDAYYEECVEVQRALVKVLD